ncbi:Glycosyltransferase [Forsythia ovata]|uniref:Glycosyltransferase n=1 Tax=Forsythia ovata TaxID=205694 RepID=A0ABD1UYM5_9LAMI
MESLVSGVPVVGFPKWTDQLTNAKLVQDNWNTGLKVQTAASAAADGGIVMADEIARCLEIVMGNGERGEEMRKQAQKWKNLAKEAVKESASPMANLPKDQTELASPNELSGREPISERYSLPNYTGKREVSSEGVWFAANFVNSLDKHSMRIQISKENLTVNECGSRPTLSTRWINIQRTFK